MAIPSKHDRPTNRIYLIDVLNLSEWAGIFAMLINMARFWYFYICEFKGHAINMTRMFIYEIFTSFQHGEEF